MKKPTDKIDKLVTVKVAIDILIILVMSGGLAWWIYSLLVG